MTENKTNNGKQNTAAKERLWSLTFISLMIVSFFASINANGLSNGTSVCIDSVGGSTTFAGLVVLAFSLSAMLVRFFAGTYSDRKGRRRVNVLGSAILLAGAFSSLIVQDVSFFLFSRIIMGIGFALVSTTTAAAVADYLPAERMGEGLGYFSLTSAVSLAIGPSLAIWAVQKYAVAGLFGGATILTCIMLALSLTCRYAPQPVYKPPVKLKESVPLSLKTKRFFLEAIEVKSLPPSIVQVFAGIGHVVYLMFMSVFATHEGIGGIQLYFLLAAGTMILVRLFAGKLIDRLPANVILVPAELVGILGLLLMLLFRNSAALLAAGICFGIFIGFLQPLLTSQAIRRAPDERRGAGSATYQIAFDIGIGAGSLLWGAVIESFGFTAAFAGGMCSIMLSLACALVLLKEKAQAK